MTDAIEFKKHRQQSTIHNPMMDNARDTQELEVRKDPLTGAHSVFNPRLEDKVAMFFGHSDEELIEKLAKESEARCFLCGNNWQAMTPTCPEDVVASGRIQVGEAVLFPNIFPAAQVHAVVRVGEKHYVPLAEFDAQPVEEAFHASLQLAKSLAGADETVKYLTINGNYLGPAGASIAHPHFQVMGGDMPFSYLERVMDCSERYYQAQKSSYWSDLVEKEKSIGQRYIGATGPVQWLAAFSPQGTNEMLGILPERTHFLEMTDADVKGLSAGLVNVLHGYADMGLSTFNFSVYSGRLGEKDDSFRCFIRVISRQNVYENYRTDDYFLQKLLRNELILTPPEVLATRMQEHFK